MHRLFTSAFVAFSLLALNSCETLESEGPGREYEPSVLVPTGLDDTESRLLGEVEEVLEQAGYRLTQSRGADYELAFEIDDGPVNADVHLNLLENGAPVVKSYARTGGPGIIFKRQEVIRQSFDKCLRDFERQLPRPGRYERSSQRGVSRGRSRYSEEHGNEFLRPRGYNDLYDGGPGY